MGFENVIETLIDGLLLPLSYFVSFEKRINFLYLGTSIALAAWVYWRSRQQQSFLRYLFPRSVWLTRSSLKDCGLFFLNGIVKVAIIAPWASLSLYLAFWTNEGLLRTFGQRESPMDQTVVAVLFAVTLLLVGDLATYGVHLLMHRVGFLWKFHKTHHSATTLTPLTQYRIHPVELIINNARSMVVIGVCTGLFDYLSHHRAVLSTWMGVSIFTAAFLLTGANLRHSHIKLTYWKPLEHILISPYQHQIHHSNDPVHHNKNLGAKLAIWDWMFGTLLRSDEVAQVSFGLSKPNQSSSSAIQKPA